MREEEVGLEENDQRVFQVEAERRANGKVTGRLHCRFCRGAGVEDPPQQDVAAKVVLEHFRNCPYRGKVTTFPLQMFEGEHDKVGTVITISVP
jgi:hypothetical protein